MKNYRGIHADTLDAAFVVASANSAVKEMRLLLEDGANLNGRDPLGQTAVHAAAGLGLTQSIRFLLEQGVDLNSRDNMDLTPLMSACSFGGVKGARAALMLLEAGAQVGSVRESDQMTALKFAARSCPAQVVEALIQRGAAVDAPRGTEQTALMLAARADNVEALKVLVAHDARLDLRCKLPWAEGRTAEGLAELEGRKKALAYLRSLRK
ncbi:MAG: ankyrin repeat domain-containing protein [Myxococcaceae bacterium]